PTANGIGSDAFALVWIERDKKLYGLNGSGWSPRGLTLEKALALAPATGQMPAHGWLPTMVPGAPKAWASLSGRFGRISLSDAARPAIAYAREGYPASPNLARMWRLALDRYRAVCTGPVFEEWYRTFAPEGRAPQVGELIRLPHHAATLEKIAATGAKDFYVGELAERIIADSRAFGGFFDPTDFAEYDVTWVEPISVNYRGYDVCEIPPNGQGIVALMALNILKEFEFTQRDCAYTLHRQWEAMKMAFADGLHYVTDPAHMQVDVCGLLCPAYGAARAQEIGDEAKIYTTQNPPGSGTVYLCTADGEGNMVSYIQSNYMGFGSGVVIRDTGISLQNRGHDFSLNPKDANCLAPRKKTYHTIIPGFLLKDGQAVGPFGVMGGYMQPQGHVQAVMNLVDFGLNPQQALDAPRWQWIRDDRFLIEDTFDMEIARQLVRIGHRVEPALDHTVFGRGQMILRLANGTLVGGTEGRTDSNIACF
ncbi:MAG: gamma-glutamyltransferase family protein, partial [Clostridia bacterium]|nr:gamma-glutamyltransferase family protein [Clostridia bacterium]